MNENARYKKNLKEPVINPYNPKNKLISDIDLKKIMNRFGVKLEIIDIDITKEAAPSLDIMRDLILEVIVPTWNSIAYYMRINYIIESLLVLFIVIKI